MAFRRKKSKTDILSPNAHSTGSSPAQNKTTQGPQEPDKSAPQSSPLCRPGYNEHKCRNVLVRYCAHIPRNYQYKDGIQRIFLVLREHIGDENMDLAGGVLYELIEIDCEHTDDAGAAYQRWRYDHMWRHSDFELPHVPHMTTITPSIVPTSKLEKWRAAHPESDRFNVSQVIPKQEEVSVEIFCAPEAPE
ncbi:hypothetical protein Micbo1qcDRAFT_208840 [Microdochium bolleyi]|uniref:Uncharacterized protein n=1 Tax=Microdochium bolleyi TaxID=196109 RepID=A0A136IP51_9PEZI|nr:hypothetical protein Micbo1qcDRAFT_208840 [Microdochium bolleyi]